MTDIKKVHMYDYCMYVRCHKCRLDNVRLFHFPTQDARRAVWIKNSGNTKLLHWTRSTLTRCGICTDHFHENDFTTPSKERIKYTAVPIPYDDNAQNKCQQRVVENNPNILQNVGEDEEELEIPVLSRTEVRRTYPAKKLDFSNDDRDMVWQKIEASDKVSPQITPKVIPQITPKVIPQISPQISPQKQVEDATISLHTEVRLLRKQLEIERRRSTNLLKINKVLRNSNIELKILLKKSKAKKRTKKLSKSEQVEDLIKRFNCNPAAAAMIKLQFHTPNAEYTPEEQQLAKQLFYSSPSSYLRLRKAGCNLPGASTVRRWT